MGADFSSAALKEVLTDRTYAQSLDFDAVCQAFNFKSDGSLGSTARPQTAAQTDSVVAQATGKSSDYANKIAGGTITTVDDLIADKENHGLHQGCLWTGP